MIAARGILLLPRRKFRRRLLLLLFLAVALVLALRAQSLPAPLPDARTILAEARAHQHQVEALQENYTFHETDLTQILDKHGKVKKTQSEEYEIFYVNTHEIRRLVARDGHPLDAARQQKEQDHVLKEIGNAQKTPPGQSPPGQIVISVGHILAMASLSQPRRVLLDGRPTLAFDFTGNPRAKAHGLAEKAARDTSGTVWIDEKDLEVRRLAARLDSTFHAGFGIVSLSRGSHLVFDQKLVNNELWLPTSADLFISAHAFGFIGARAQVHVTDSGYKKFHAEAVQQPGAGLAPPTTP